MRKAVKCQKIILNPLEKPLRFFTMPECKAFTSMSLHPFIKICGCVADAFSSLFRYDPDTKSLKPMKPLPVELIQSLENDLDFLGPYPFLDCINSFIPMSDNL